MGNPDELYVIASDAGYGFVTKVEDLYAKNKNGKTVLSVPEGARVLPPVLITQVATDNIAVITNTGRLLLHPVSELPTLSKGKGNKIISLAASASVAREEYITSLIVVPRKASLTLHVGQKQHILKTADLVPYLGERGRRGVLLPKAMQRVHKITT